MNKLLKDAIADAKAVRETAMANAKLALEEAFAPKLQSMLSHKIKEEMEEEEPMAEMEDEEEMTMEMDHEDEMKSEGEGGEAPVEDEVESEEEEEVEVSDEGSDEEASAEAEEAEMSDEELEEILRELEGEEEESMEEGDYSDDEEMNEMSDEDESMEEGMKSDDDEMNEADEEEEIDLEEIIKALREEESEEESMEEEAHAESDGEAHAELEEAYNVIKFLRSKLNEVNLLNAKLLYVNKLFKKGELTENKKIKIIETFDRVKTVREAKLVYATLAESIISTAPIARKTKKSVAKRRKGLTEGIASAPTRGTKKPIVENTVYNRFTELINYNK